jgi:hypothetical protein
LAELAESFLKHGAETLGGGERHQIVVHVDAETLRDSVAGRCEIENGPALPAETVRRLGCDCSVVMLVENPEGEPLNVGRKTRSIPPALRRALNSRDQGCRFPGCTHTRYVDAHHARHRRHALARRTHGLQPRNRRTAREGTPRSRNRSRGNALKTAYRARPPAGTPPAPALSR